MSDNDIYSQEEKLARAGDLGYGSSGLCPYCENMTCDKKIFLEQVNYNTGTVVEWCVNYKNKEDGF